eukprot:CAMPEP_0195288500 /NCGR_PEP_ID=MMETSP0707-20130614/5144_1 /TAXON_ID=33640 /ORGANISM="Asterionellopsis glacialis, Strain CCMP134" /LENGTH=507 /DNA_ID=CAMNT_0040348379 /DNA_START=224 /DNA_END=1747 /DNA_ORIENTATION=+
MTTIVTTDDGKPDFHVERNIRYSNKHNRNVLDAYSPSLKDDDFPLPTLLFVHGGMWIGGSKEQASSYTTYDIAKGLFTNIYRSIVSPPTTKDDNTKHNKKGSAVNDDHHSEEQKDSRLSNIGMTIARHNARACIMNYRLAAASPQTQQSSLSGDDSLADTIDEKEKDQQKENVTDDHCHPNQVMDVARAIVFLIRRAEEEELRKGSNSKGKQASGRPTLFIGGHSAGAHLAALALSDLQYIKRAMEEQGLLLATEISSNSENDDDDNAVMMMLLTKHIAGFIGMSGVYNLRRMAMSPLSAITIGPAFLKSSEEVGRSKSSNTNTGSNKVVDVTLEASPIHTLLRQSKKEHDSSSSCGKSIIRPLLPDIPLLLLNAESDFELEKDVSELLVAVEQFQKSSPSSSPATTKHCTISKRNHFSIVQDFGIGLVDATRDNYKAGTDASHNSKKSDDTSNDNGWTMQRFLNETTETMPLSITSLASQVMLNDQVDQAAIQVLEFMGSKATKIH